MEPFAPFTFTVLVAHVGGLGGGSIEAEAVWTTAPLMLVTSTKLGALVLMRGVALEVISAEALAGVLGAEEVVSVTELGALFHRHVLRPQHITLERPVRGPIDPAALVFVSRNVRIADRLLHSIPVNTQAMGITADLPVIATAGYRTFRLRTAPGR